MIHALTAVLLFLCDVAIVIIGRGDDWVSEVPLLPVSSGGEFTGRKAGGKPITQLM